MRLLVLCAALASACTPLQQQAARETALATLECAAVKGFRELAPTVSDGLRSGDWRDALTGLAGRAGADVVDCAVAYVLRSANAQHKATSTAMIAMDPEPPNERQITAQRAETWITDRKRQVRL